MALRASARQMDDEGGEEGPKDRWVRSGEYKVDDDASGAGPLDDRGACTPAGGVVEAGHIDALTVWSLLGASLSRSSRAARSRAQLYSLVRLC
jgi:hypothetical protein